MNILRDANILTSPASSPSNSNPSISNMELDTPMTKTSASEKASKTAFKKEELEKIAKELKKKLSKASITAKQQQQQNGPDKIHKSTSHSHSSPLKEYVSKNTLESPAKYSSLLSSSPLYSPNNKSPTHMRTSAAASLLSSSPLNDSPIRKSTTSSPLKSNSTMVLQSVTSSPARPSSLKPSPPLNNKGSAHHANKTGSATGTHQQTTPTLPKKQLNVNTATNPLLTTPTQPSQKSNGNHDDEGADLLMYLATSPSPAKSYFPNAPKLGAKQPAKQPPSQPQSQSQAPVASQSGDPLGSSAPNSSGGAFSIHKHTSSNSSANSFIAPPPPLTPKRHINTTMNSKTPQNRLTPSVNLFNNMVNNGSSGLPSSGLALTPAGFNMNDYVNFFSPSPGGAHLSKNFLKTPDFNNLLAANANSSQAQSKVVDGKMINFDKVGLFKNTESRD